MTTPASPLDPDVAMYRAAVRLLAEADSDLLELFDKLPMSAHMKRTAAHDIIAPLRVKLQAAARIIHREHELGACITQVIR